MKKSIEQEVFFNLDDAILWFEVAVKGIPADQHIHEASIRWVNHQWVASILYGSRQLELFD